MHLISTLEPWLLFSKFELRGHSGPFAFAPAPSLMQPTNANVQTMTQELLEDTMPRLVIILTKSISISYSFKFMDICQVSIYSFIVMDIHHWDHWDSVISTSPRVFLPPPLWRHEARHGGKLNLPSILL